MRVALRFTALLVLGIVVVHLVNVVIRVRRERQLFQDVVGRDSRVLGRTLGNAIQHVWRTRGEAEALAILDHANELESHLTIRWVWLDARQGDRTAPLVPRAALAPVERGRSAVVPVAEGDGVIHTYVPVAAPVGRPGAIEITDPQDDEEGYVQASIARAAISGGVLVLLCAGLTWVLGVVMIGRPTQRLVEQARRIGRGDLGERLNLRTAGEFGQLAAEIDQMSDNLQHAREQVAAETESRIAALEQLRHADRLTTVGALASGIAHELGTPLNVIDGHARLIREGQTNEEQLRDSAEVISRQCRRMTEIIRGLLDFSRRSVRRSATDLREVAHETLRMVAPLLKKQGIEASIEDGAGAAQVAVEFGAMQQVLMNMVINGIQAMPDGGQLVLRVERRRAARPGRPPPGEPCWALSVEDSGQGMDLETRKRVFEPFFTTKDVGEGTGLGLSVAHGIVHEHDGWIDVASAPGQGCRFTVFLPEEPGA